MLCPAKRRAYQLPHETLAYPDFCTLGVTGTAATSYGANKPTTPKGPDAQEQLWQLAKSSGLELGYDAKSRRFVDLLTIEEDLFNPDPNFDPHVELVLKVLEHLMGFLDQNNHKPVKGKKQNIDGAESSFRYEIRLPDLGTFESTTTVFHGKNGSNDLELLENIRMRRELIIDGGHRIEVPVPWQKGSKKSAPLDPVIRGRLIRAFYVMGFRELAHRRTFEPAMDGNGTFEKNAWLHSIEVPEHLLKKR